MAKTIKAKAKKRVASATHGIDAMVEAVHADILSREDVPASAKEVTKVAVKAILQAEHDLIQGAVADGDKVTYVGFGTFEQRHRSERTGRNPQTGEELHIEAKTVPAFKAGKAFKDAVK